MAIEKPRKTVSLPPDITRYQKQFEDALEGMRGDAIFNDAQLREIAFKLMGAGGDSVQNTMESWVPQPEPPPAANSVSLPYRYASPFYATNTNVNYGIGFTITKEDITSDGTDALAKQARQSLQRALLDRSMDKESVLESMKRALVVGFDPAANYKKAEKPVPLLGEKTKRDITIE